VEVTGGYEVLLLACNTLGALVRLPKTAIFENHKVTTECQCNTSRLYDFYNIMKASNTLQKLYTTKNTSLNIVYF